MHLHIRVSNLGIFLIFFIHLLKSNMTVTWYKRLLTTTKDNMVTVSLAGVCPTLGSPWAAKRVRNVSRGWQTTVAEQAANPPHTKCTPAVWLSYGVILWTTSVIHSKLANCEAQIHTFRVRQTHIKCFTKTGCNNAKLVLVYVHVTQTLPGQPQSRRRGAVQGGAPSRKQRAPPLYECDEKPEITPSTFPPASLKTDPQSAAVEGGTDIQD